MAWKVPGGKKPDVPPELDEVLRHIKTKLKGLFDQHKRLTSAYLPPQIATRAIIAFVLFACLGLWVLAGFYIVDAPEKAIILRFGRYLTTVGPGLHWVPPLIESKYVRNMQQIFTETNQVEALTQDDNIISVNVSVHYRINQLYDYFFNTVDPDVILQQATVNALRQALRQTTLETLLSTGSDKVGQNTQQILRQMLEHYSIGLVVTAVTVQSVTPPSEVMTVFNDAIKAREEAKQSQVQAAMAADRIIATAQMDAAQTITAAETYQQKIILNAKSDTAQFLALLPIYRKFPQVARERLSSDALQSLFQEKQNASPNTLSAPSVPTNVVVPSMNASRPSYDLPRK